MLYAVEPTWNSRKGMEGEYQAAINCMGGATLGAYQSTPTSIVIAEGGVAPARASLDRR